LARKPFLIESSRFDWTESVWVDSIAKMSSWPNFKLLRPKLSPNRTQKWLFFCIFGPNQTKNGIFRGQKFDYFCEIFVIFSRFWKIENSKFSKQKMTLKSNFDIHKKLVPTWIPTWTFEFKFGMQGFSDKALSVIRSFGLDQVSTDLWKVRKNLRKCDKTWESWRKSENFEVPY